MGVGVEFGPERIRNLVIVCPKSVIPDKQKHACALSGNTEMPNISLSNVMLHICPYGQKDY